MIIDMFVILPYDFKGRCYVYVITQLIVYQLVSCIIYLSNKMDVNCLKLCKWQKLSYVFKCGFVNNFPILHGVLRCRYWAQPILSS